MGQVAKNINGRTYTMSCNDGEEPRLEELLTYVETHMSLLTEQFGQVGDDRLMLMTAVMIADELWDLRDELEENARAAQDKLRELADLELAGADQTSSVASSNDDQITEIAEGDDDVDDVVSDEDRVNPTGHATASTEMDIGIDQPAPAPSEIKRAYR